MPSLEVSVAVLFGILALFVSAGGLYLQWLAVRSRNRSECHNQSVKSGTSLSRTTVALGRLFRASAAVMLPTAGKHGETLELCTSATRGRLQVLRHIYCATSHIIFHFQECLLTKESRRQRASRESRRDLDTLTHSLVTSSIRIGSLMKQQRSTPRR